MVEYPARKLAGFFMRFTIRDLLWLMSLVAIGTLLIAERISIRKERAVLRQEIAEERAVIAKQNAALTKSWTNVINVNTNLSDQRESLESDIRYHDIRLSRKYERSPSADEIEASYRTSRDSE